MNIPGRVMTKNEEILSFVIALLFEKRRVVWVAYSDIEGVTVLADFANFMRNEVRRIVWKKLKDFLVKIDNFFQQLFFDFFQE